MASFWMTVATAKKTWTPSRKIQGHYIFSVSQRERPREHTY
ncbi:unnamed protein product [Brassica rapa subsp. narinosa]